MTETESEFFNRLNDQSNGQDETPTWNRQRSARTVESDLENENELDEFLESVVAAEPISPVDQGQLKAIWKHSSTFKNQWSNPTNMGIGNRGNAKSLKSIIATCYHFKLSMAECSAVLCAWMSKHDVLPDDFDGWVQETLMPIWLWVSESNQPQQKPGVDSGDFLSKLGRIASIEKWEFDASTGRFTVSGVVKN